MAATSPCPTARNPALERRLHNVQCFPAPSHRHGLPAALLRFRLPALACVGWLGLAPVAKQSNPNSRGIKTRRANQVQQLRSPPSPALCFALGTAHNTHNTHEHRTCTPAVFPPTMTAESSGEAAAPSDGAAKKGLSNDQLKTYIRKARAKITELEEQNKASAVDAGVL